jgi:hypothetical protein
VVVSDGVDVADVEGLDLAVVVVQDQVGLIPLGEVDPILLLRDEVVRLHVVVVVLLLNINRKTIPTPTAPRKSIRHIRKPPKQNPPAVPLRLHLNPFPLPHKPPPPPLHLQRFLSTLKQSPHHAEKFESMFCC